MREGLKQNCTEYVWLQTSIAHAKAGTGRLRSMGQFVLKDLRDNYGAKDMKIHKTSTACRCIKVLFSVFPFSLGQRYRSTCETYVYC